MRTNCSYKFDEATFRVAFLIDSDRASRVPRRYFRMPVDAISVLLVVHNTYLLSRCPRRVEIHPHDMACITVLLAACTKEVEDDKGGSLCNKPNSL